MNKLCSVCDGNILRSISYKNQWSDLFTNKQILVCETCGFGQIEPKIDSKSIQDFYRYEYRSKSSPHYVDFSRRIPSPYFYRAKSISQILLGLQYLDEKKEYNFLDVGAGLGRSFISVKEIFKANVNLFTVEEDLGAKNYYKNYYKDVVIASNISDFNDIMDIVLMSHSLEHFDITDMQNLFKDISNAMDDNGIFIIEVPHADFRDENYEKKRPKDTPHLCFFSLDSMSKLVKLYGFELCYIDTSGPLIGDMFFQENHSQKSIVTLSKFILKKFGLLSLISRLKRNIFIKVHLIRSKHIFHKNVNFKYGGKRAVIRCVLKKSQKKLS